MKTLFYTTYMIDGHLHYLVRDNQYIVFIGVNDTLETIQHRFKNSQFMEKNLGFEAVIKELDEYYAGQRQSFGFPVKHIGTPFQQEVWKQLRSLKYGEIVTYSDIAMRYGDIKKVRAVANAIGANPILIVNPCHRVIGKDGTLHGFRSGLDLKKKLLKLETGKVYD